MSHWHAVEHTTHISTTARPPLLLFAALKQTTVPIGQDDINEKAQDA